MARKPRGTARRQPREAVHIPPRVERIVDSGMAEIVQKIAKERRP